MVPRSPENLFSCLCRLSRVGEGHWGPELMWTEKDVFKRVVNFHSREDPQKGAYEGHVIVFNDK